MRKAAILANGLDEDSRIRRKMAGINCTMEQLLLGILIDRLTGYITGKPSYFTRDYLLKSPTEQENQYQVFNSAEDFENARKHLLERERE